LRLAIEHIDQVMGEGSAYAYPEIVAAFVRSATAIRNQEMAFRARPRGRGERP
jgi:hypothetical protein